MIEQCFKCKCIAEEPMEWAEATFSNGTVVPIRLCIDCVEQSVKQITDACFGAMSHGKVEFHGKVIVVVE